MKAHGRLFELLEEWRGLTTDESEAIRALDWPKLDQCQTAKERLMSEISTKLDRGNDNGIVRQRVQELIELERQNERDLVAARTKLETERVVINRASRAVRQLSQAYRSQSNANWHSYS